MPPKKPTLQETPLYVKIPTAAVDKLDRAAAALEAQVIAWRRDLHQHPELGNREFRTAGIVAAHLKSLGLDEVKTGVGHTGVVGLLKGGKPGPVYGRLYEAYQRANYYQTLHSWGPVR